jgi:uncharacterized protein YndB with AHSA1/START domain/uncharacterized glyoxalase superfamily protein PhnB
MTDATPFLMFEGRAEEALDFYVATIPDSRIEHIDRYGAGEPGPEGSVRMARAVVAGLPILANDSFVHHAFTFTPSVSFMLTCKDEDEVDRLAGRRRRRADARRQLRVQPNVRLGERSLRRLLAGESPMTDPIILTVSRDIAASPERAFDAWLDPAVARRFLFATTYGEMLTCEIDARVGGRGLIVERRPSGDARHRLLFEEIDRPRRLVFLFAADPAEEGQWTRVTIEIAPAPTGTHLTLTHEMDPAWAAYEEQTRHGWTMILDTLSRTIGEER